MGQLSQLAVNALNGFLPSPLLSAVWKVLIYTSCQSSDTNVIIMKADYNNYTLRTRYHFENQSLAHLSDITQSETEQTEAEAILVQGKIYSSDTYFVSLTFRTFTIKSGSRKVLYWPLSKIKRRHATEERVGTSLCRLKQTWKYTFPLNVETL